MGDFFAKISSQFTAPLLLSASFPVLLFLTAFTLVVLPITPFGHDLTAAVQDPTYWQQHSFVALLLTVFVLVLSVLLYNMNTSIVRLYEGYPWKDAWIGRAFVWYRKRHYERVARARRRIERLRREARIAGVRLDVPDVVAAQPKLARIMNAAYPVRQDLVLPTRLGNTIRAFETYPIRQYAIDAVNLWPRLQAVVDSNLAQSLDSVKTSFDFMIHCSFLSAILAVVTAASGLYWKTSSNAALAPWLLWVIGFGAASYAFYLASIRRALEWGSQVITAFDLYRLPLLAKLGYDQKPADLAAERRLWENINYKLLYPDERTYPDLPYATPASALVVEPSGTVLQMRRSVTVHGDGSREITLQVKNIDPTAWEATGVIAQEQIPSGMVYVPGSVSLSDGTATLRSVEPLVIELGPLAYDHSKSVVYRIASPGSPQRPRPSKPASIRATP
jgi:uncharacterized repeat protein (TIGR01451 family)